MIEFNIFHLLIFFLLVALQTIVGVGILVLGTPILLILNYNIIEVISILLPISILTSLTNLIYFKLINKISIFKFGNQIKKSFFLICIPSIVLGIIILKYFNEIINFKVMVSILIFLSLIVRKYYKNNLVKLSTIKQKIILFIIGLVHGVSNSGGALLSMFVLNVNNNNKNRTRYNLTFFYFFLAFLQYIIFMFIFKKTISLIIIINLIFVIFIGILFGNYLVRFIENNKFNFLIEILTLFSAIFLIINS